MIDTNYNYLVGNSEGIPADYDYINRPDPETNGCKRLYGDVIKVFFSDLDVENLEQQFLADKNKKSENEKAWDMYEKLNNSNPKPRNSKKKPPFYTIKYKDYLLSTDYIGPSIYWAKKQGLTDKEIIKILAIGRTIGGHIAWPRGDGQNTINKLRGGGKSFYDRIDWTLYLLKTYYESEKNIEDTKHYLVNNLSKDEADRCITVLEAIKNYKKWFDEFNSFEDLCIRFRLIGSFVDDDCQIIWLAPMTPILPEDYRLFAENNINAIKQRNTLLEISTSLFDKT